MKTVVITGSSRGLGFELAKNFRKNGWNTVISATNADKLASAKAKLEEIPGSGRVAAFKSNVTSSEELQALIDYSVSEFGGIDIWINNAGVNQPMKALWELSEKEIDSLMSIDLRGAVLGSKLALTEMAKSGKGAIYNVEGYGSNDATMLGLNMYGTCKRAVTHFTKALAGESEERKTGVIVGRLSPGIMITDFTVKAFSGAENIDLPEKTKKVYNILGDYPDVVAEFLVNKMITNTKNNAHIEWLTGGKAAWRFMTAGFNKRDFFSEK